MMDIKLDVYDNGWMKLDIEEVDGNAFAHMYIEGWSPSKRKLLPKAMEDVQKVGRALGYPCLYISVLKGDNLLRKFLVMIQARPVAETEQIEIWRYPTWDS